MTATWNAVLTIVGTSAFWIIVGVWALKNPDVLARWISVLSGLFAGIWHRAEQTHVASDIQAHIDHFVKELGKEAKDVLPYGIRIKWVAQTTKEAFVAGDKIIVRMNYHSDQQRNLVVATTAYVSKGLLPHARRHLHPNVLAAMDFTAVKKLLVREKLGPALDYFFEEVVNPAIKDSPAIREYWVTMDGLDEKGFFSRILLREFLELGRSLMTAVPREEIAEETVSFVKFLDRIANKEHGEDVDPTFYGSKICMSLVYVARPEVIDTYGYSRHLLWIDKCQKTGISSVYICGLGHNVRNAETLARICERKGFTTIETIHRYQLETRGKTTPAICVVAQVNPVEQ
jgi:hypothetical protein